MNWYAKNAPPDNIKGIRGEAVAMYLERLRVLSAMPPVNISVWDKL